jgi:hypothetical protein
MNWDEKAGPPNGSGQDTSPGLNGGRDRMAQGRDRSKQAPFFARAVPVSRERHAASSLEFVAGHGFAARTNSVPIVVSEFAQVAKEYPIVFVRSGDGVTPVALFGVGPEENRFVAADGSWRGRYVPAFLRRYPFVLAETGEPGRLVLCIDEDFAGLNERGRGKPLFGSDGKPSGLLDDATKFLRALRNFAAQTARFGEAVRAAGILSPARIEADGGGGKKAAIAGTLVVDRRKLKALPPDTLAGLARRDWLELIYLHLASMDGGGRVADRRAADALREAPRGALLS